MGKKRVVMTRQRVVEERVITTVTAPNDDAAIASAKHLVDGSVVDWRFSKTLEMSETSVEVKDLNPKKEDSNA